VIHEISGLRLKGGYTMDPAEKQAIKEKMEEKGVGFDKAAEELKVPEQVLALYFKDDSNPIPKRIIDGLNNLLE
jgi:hypothetical protein